MEDITEKEALYILRNTDKYSQIGIDRAIRKILQINRHRNNGRTKLKKRIEKLEKENKELKEDSMYVLDQTLGAFEKNWCIDWNFTEIREKYILGEE